MQINNLRVFSAMILAVMLGACTTVPTAEVTRVETAAQTPPPRTASRSIPPTNPPPVSIDGFRAPRVMNPAGLEYVIGANAMQLQQVFGQPRLNVIEGDARKLQFAGEACVLDIYLYPLRPGAEPTATYVDARRASDALDVDRAACANALRR